MNVDFAQGNANGATLQAAVDGMTWYGETTAIACALDEGANQMNTSDNINDVMVGKYLTFLLLKEAFLKLKDVQDLSKIQNLTNGLFNFKIDLKMRVYNKLRSLFNIFSLNRWMGLRTRRCEYSSWKCCCSRYHYSCYRL